MAVTVVVGVAEVEEELGRVVVVAVVVAAEEEEEELRRWSSVVRWSRSSR